MDPLWVEPLHYRVKSLFLLLPEELFISPDSFGVLVLEIMAVESSAFSLI